MGTVRVSDIAAATEFYRDLLLMEPLSEADDQVILRCGGQFIMLNLSPVEWTGGDTGLYISTPSIYDLHRRLVDEAVVFMQPPQRGELGLTAVLSDDDGNLLTFIEL